MQTLNPSKVFCFLKTINNRVKSQASRVRETKKTKNTKDLNAENVFFITTIIILENILVIIQKSSILIQYTYIIAFSQEI